MLASDFSHDRILRYRLADGRLTEDGVAATMTAGSGPRHIAFSHDGRFFYVMSEVGDRVGVFSWDGSRGTAKRLEEHHAADGDAHGDVGLLLHQDAVGSLLHDRAAEGEAVGRCAVLAALAEVGVVNAVAKMNRS